MALRAKKPAERPFRIKMAMRSAPGVGKTTAAIQMPKPYIIDLDGGTDHYNELIEKAGGAVFDRVEYQIGGVTKTRVPNKQDIIKEIEALIKEDHDYLTLVIDPYTALFENVLETNEDKMGSAHGRHYGEAYKFEKRFINLLKNLDMHIVLTTHIKDFYRDDNGQRVKDGYTFDAGKHIDRLFDLAFELERTKDGKRYATPIKSRMPAIFPEFKKFEWSYQELETRVGKEVLWRKKQAQPITDNSGKALLDEVSDALEAQDEAMKSKTTLEGILEENKESFSKEQIAFIEKALSENGETADEWHKIMTNIEKVIQFAMEYLEKQKGA